MGNATGKCKHHWRSTVSGASDTMMSALSSRKLRGFILVEVSNCASEKFSRLYQGQVYLSAFPQVQGSVLWERNKCVSFLFKCTLISIEKQPAMQQEQNPLFPTWRLLHERGCPAKKQMHSGRLSRELTGVPTAFRGFQTVEIIEKCFRGRFPVNTGNFQKVILGNSSKRNIRCSVESNTYSTT